METRGHIKDAGWIDPPHTLPVPSQSLQKGPRLSQAGSLWEFLDSKESGAKEGLLSLGLGWLVCLLRTPAQVAGLRIHSSPPVPFSISINDLRLRPACAILCLSPGTREGCPQPLHGDPT